MARQLSRNPHVDPWKKASTGIMNVPTFDRFKPGEDKGLSDPTWGGGKLGAVSTGAGENLQRTLKPIARILPTMQEHAQHGWEGMTGEYEDVPWSKGWGSLNEPVGRGLGAFQTLMSPISGAYTALFDEPVSETLQQYGGMDKETADMAAMGLGVALPLGWLGFSKWAKINPFATEVLAEKLFGKTMPGTHWARGTVDTDQARRSVLKAGAVTAGATAVGGPAAVRCVRGLISKAATPIVARSAILTGIGAGISKFVQDVKKANADQIDFDVAARQRARDSGSSRVFGETMDDERARIVQQVENENYWEVLQDLGRTSEGHLQLNQIEVMDDVFVGNVPGDRYVVGKHGEEGSQVKTSLQGMLREDWLVRHAEVPEVATGRGKELPPRKVTQQEFDDLVKRGQEELDLSIEDARGFAHMQKLMIENEPQVQAPPGLLDSLKRRFDNPTPWQGRKRHALEAADDIPKNIDNPEVWREVEGVRERADMGINAYVDRIENWDETMGAIDWYQKNDPEGLINVLRDLRGRWKKSADVHQAANPDSRPYPYPAAQQIKLLDDLIVETEALIKPLQKVERGRAPGPGSLQQRLDRAAAERARQAAKKDKKKEDGFSWLDPMGWRKHPWFGGKE